LISAPAALEKIWREADCNPAALDRLKLTGAEPVLPSSFAVGTAMQVSVAASALAAAEFWRARGGETQTVTVDMRAAAIASRSERYLNVDGGPAPELWDKIAGLYRCGDGRWVRLHTNFPHHRDGVLRILQCEHDKAAVAQALTRWKAVEFEDTAAAAGLVVSAARSFAEWDQAPQGQAITRLPLLGIEKIADASPRPLSKGTRPLSGIRVLDLTRIIAGPVCGLTLAAHGADVLLVTSPNLPSIAPLVIDTGRGKLSTQLDLTSDNDRTRFEALLRDADVIIQGYRPGGLERLGYGPDAVAQLRPGIVYVSLSAYGHRGPWAERRGFDSLVQTASGINLAEAEAAGSETPRPLPSQILDHATGYLMAFAAMAALLRQRQGGGSWHARLSLAQTGFWLRSLGRVDGLSLKEPARDDVCDRLEESRSGFGTLSAVKHPAMLDKTPPHWTRPSVPLGTHPPVWP
jgi:crotonobetainyl-CoA:carnitine CoA-transferase CaiB-like acyl-CoA transferase